MIRFGVSLTPLHSMKYEIGMAKSLLFIQINYMCFELKEYAPINLQTMEIMNSDLRPGASDGFATDSNFVT